MMRSRKKINQEKKKFESIELIIKLTTYIIGVG